MRQATITLAVTAALLTGCTVSPPLDASRSPIQLHVSAAASLRSAFEALAPGFEKANGVELVFDFASSGVLRKRIESGAPADVFASADPGHVDALAEMGLVSRPTDAFARNDLVLFARRDGRGGVSGPEDLARIGLLAIGDPESAPHGAKAREWLISLGMWERLAPRLVYAENAAQTRDYVARGEVDAGIGFASEVRGERDLQVLHTVSRGVVAPARYVAGVVSRTSHEQAARRFVAYLSSPMGQAALLAAGFLGVSDPGPATPPGRS